MARTRKALINSLIQVGGQLVSWSLTWCLLIMLPRALGDDGFGELFYAISYGMIFSTLINLGINSYLMKQVSIICPQPEHSPDEVVVRNNELASLLGNAVSLKMLLAVGVYGLQSLFICLWTDDETLRQAVLIIGLGTCFSGITPMFTGTFRGRERMGAPTLAVIAEKLLITGGCFFLLRQGYGLIPVCWMHSAGSLLQLVVQAVSLRCIQSFRPSLDLKLMKRILVGGVPFLVWVVFSELYLRVDVIMLEWLTNKAVVGWYGAAFRIYVTFFFLPNILLNSVSPTLIRLGAEDSQSASLSQASERLMNLLIYAAIPLGFGISAVAAPLITLVFGDSFLGAIPVMVIFGFSIPLVCIDMIFGTVLIAKGKERQWAIMAIVAAFFNPLINYWLIPYASDVWGNGGIGAAYATALTELLMMGGALWLMPAGIFTRQNLITALKGVIAGASMVLVLRVWGTQNLLYLIPAGAAIYLLLAFLLGVPPKKDLSHMLHAVKSLIRRKQSNETDVPYTPTTPPSP